MKLNLPNKLTLLRVMLIPFFMFFIIFPVFGKNASALVAAGIFIVTSLTDMLDGKIARKYNLITDFGKFLDPLADKLMIFGGYIAILATCQDRGAIFGKILVWATFIIILRELAVTSMRMVISNGEGIVIPAGWLGKVKTTLQILCMIVLLLEPVLLPMTDNIVSYVFLGLSVIMTLWSGINYFIAYWPHLDSNK